VCWMCGPVSRIVATLDLVVLVVVAVPGWYNSSF
jgi:hypothetical protein